MYFKITLLFQFKDLFRIPFHVTPDPNEKVDRGKCVFQCCISEFLLAFFFTHAKLLSQKQLPAGSQLKLPNVPNLSLIPWWVSCEQQRITCLPVE